MICEQLEEGILGRSKGTGTETVENQEDVFKPEPIHLEAPHVSWDNCFWGDSVLEWAHEKGFGLAMTCRPDWSPKGIPSGHLQKERTPVNKRSKSARFNDPVFFTKDFTDSSIQLTALLRSLFIAAQKKGVIQTLSVSQWSIQMHESREL